MKAILLIILLTNLSIFADIIINDTTANRGDIIKIPIILKNLAFPDTLRSLNLTIEYDNSLIEPLSLDTNCDCTLQNTTFERINNFKKSEINISGFLNKSGVLANLNLEILASKDSITYLLPTKLKIENSVSTQSFDSAFIYVANPLIELDNNLISSIYPNPFNDSFTLDFYVNKETKFNFNIIDLKGKLSNENQLFEVEIFKDELMISDENLQKGNYKAIFKTKYNQMSDGLYLLEIKLNTQLFYKFIQKVN